jgi:hypothetical protein
MIHRFLLRYITAPLEASVKEALRPVTPYLRRLAMGAGLIFLGMLMLAPVGFMVVIALFFAIAGLPYVAAALWAALWFGLLSLLCVLVGFRLARKPR